MTSLFRRRKKDVARHLRDAQFRIARPRSASPRGPKRGRNVAPKSHRTDPRRLQISQSHTVTSLFRRAARVQKPFRNVVEKTLPDLPMPCKGGNKRAPKSTTPTAFRPAAQNVAQKAIQIAPDRPSRSGGTRRSPGKQPVAQRGSSPYTRHRRPKKRDPSDPIHNY